MGYIPGPEDHKPYQGTLGTLEVILIWSRTRLGAAMDPTGPLSWTLFLSVFAVLPAVPDIRYLEILSFVGKSPPGTSHSPIRPIFLDRTQDKP